MNAMEKVEAAVDAQNVKVSQLAMQLKRIGVRVTETEYASVEVNGSASLGDEFHIQVTSDLGYALHQYLPDQHKFITHGIVDSMEGLLDLVLKYRDQIGFRPEPRKARRRTAEFTSLGM
jgi:hypothetical protein